MINATTPVKKATGRPRRTPKPTPKVIAELNSGFTDLELKTPKTTPIKTPTTRKRIRKTAIVAKRNLHESFSGIDSKGDQSSRAKRVPVKKEPKKATKSAQLTNENIHDKEPAIEASPSKHTQFRKLEKNRIENFVDDSIYHMLPSHKVTLLISNGTHGFRTYTHYPRYKEHSLN